MQRTEHQQGVIDAVVGKDRYGLVDGKAAPQQGAADAAGLRQGIAISELTPAGAGTLGQKAGCRSFARPMLQPLADATRIRRKALRRPQHQDTALAPLDVDRGAGEVEWSKGWLGHFRSFQSPFSMVAMTAARASKPL